MFEKIYSDVSNELLRNNITDTNIVVSMYRNKIVDMVENYFPMYERNLGGPQQIIEVIARQVGNKDEMEKYLDENVFKWKNYLNDNLQLQFLWLKDILIVKIIHMVIMRTRALKSKFITFY